MSFTRRLRCQSRSKIGRVSLFNTLLRIQMLNCWNKNRQYHAHPLGVDIKQKENLEGRRSGCMLHHLVHHLQFSELEFISVVLGTQCQIQVTKMIIGTFTTISTKFDQYIIRDISILVFSHALAPALRSVIQVRGSLSFSRVALTIQRPTYPKKTERALVFVSIVSNCSRILDLARKIYFEGKLC